MRTKRLNRLHNQNTALFIGIYLILLAGYDAMFNGYLSDIVRDYRYSYSGVATGEVSIAETYGGGKVCRKLKLYYFYDVSGKTYSSNNIRNSDSCVSTLENFKDLRPGDTVKVFYDLKDHTASVLDVNGSSESIYLFVLAYIIVPLFLWFFGALGREY